MIEDLAKNLVELKKEFAKIYEGKSQVQEVIPKSTTDTFSIPQQNLELLHQFATKNPIYYHSFELKVNDVDCIVYEGDINKYWLNSIQHGSSNAPFSPTWIMSAYIGALYAKELGFSEIIDIGSGDGRIAFCGKVLDMESYSIELDDILVDLQKLLVTSLDFHPHCSDATTFDYSTLNLTRPIFFIGGLAQMGGTGLASGVLEKINSELKQKSGWAFAGTLSPKYAADPKGEAGWGTLIENNDLKKIQKITLPTVWTFHEPDDTPYIFAESG
ncbi:hypothetical protein [Nitrosopumilus sp.]|uniref:hypothetical protein n=1 Tax=Nitrosopumilus sp. TaxID=2024843 RepID=UPI00262B1CBD|nr:hypothetical protein [Nitrosopumilus sp.]